MNLGKVRSKTWNDLSFLIRDQQSVLNDVGLRTTVGRRISRTKNDAPKNDPSSAKDYALAVAARCGVAT